MSAIKKPILETQLKDILLTEDDLQMRLENQEQVFEISQQDEVIGCVTLFNLKSFVSENNEMAENMIIRSYESNDWIALYEHPLFQRRKPQIVSAESILSEDDQEFYILKKGQKVGPFNKTTLIELVSNNEILLTDMVSSNAGLTWIKLYQIEGFERRTFKDSEQLPGIPSSELMGMVSEKSKKIGETTDAFSSLAYLGNLKRGKAIEQSNQQSIQEEMPKKALASSIYKILSVLSIIGIIYFLFNIKGQINAPLNAENETAFGEQSDPAALLDPESQVMPFENNSMEKMRNNGINDQGRKSKFQMRKLRPVRPATAGKSFMETQTYRDTQDSENMANDENYYYDNNSPMELDPIRSQISKENYQSEADLNTEAAPAPGGNQTLFNQDTSN